MGRTKWIVRGAAGALCVGLLVGGAAIANAVEARLTADRVLDGGVITGELDTISPTTEPVPETPGDVAVLDVPPPTELDRGAAGTPAPPVDDDDDDDFDDDFDDDDDDDDDFDDDDDDDDD